MEEFSNNNYVDHIKSKSPNHPHGIKVQLDIGEVGRGKSIIE
ncbi:MAG: DUF2196 domain-containing protein [Bacteroidetes bacterium]|nr:DUF2196 domain-containing protein [Bacteroidota bacterium]MBT3935870.1 DUF2196 domain-containing protein [Bacteroidota bacterium]MBT4340120.1 DUF2196 domain-containing protein [Bacteroidota bacterium]MBT4729195.1 DUF2196 domain-containing protein [Bacteroidota bacterium]MBT4968617.1 DUF2196 domain-containing protein [Bacteroidota bacterium]